MRSVPSRVERRGDLFSGVSGKGSDPRTWLRRLEDLLGSTVRLVGVSCPSLVREPGYDRVPWENSGGMDHAPL